MVLAASASKGMLRLSTRTLRTLPLPMLLASLARRIVCNAADPLLRFCERRVGRSCQDSLQKVASGPATETTTWHD